MDEPRPTLPLEVLFRIIDHLKRPLPTPGDREATWKDLHQQDLVNALTVSKEFYRHAAKQLYDEVVVYDIANFLTGADEPLPITPTDDVTDTKDSSSNPMETERTIVNLTESEPDRATIPYHKQHLLEMVKAIHLIHIPRGAGPSPPPGHLVFEYEEQVYRDAQDTLNRIQPPRNLIPNADRLTFASWSSSCTPYNHYPAFWPYICLEAYPDPRSYLSAPQICHGGLINWGDKRPGSTRLTHHLHWDSIEGVLYIPDLVSSDSNVVWLERFYKKASRMNRNLRRFAKNLEKLSTSVSPFWIRGPWSQKTSINIIIPSRFAANEVSRKMAKEMQEACRQGCGPTYPKFPGEITIEFAKPGQSCDGCKRIVSGSGDDMDVRVM